MILKRVIYEPQVEITFTSEDVQLLIGLSQRHYDHACRAISQVGGFVYGIAIALATKQAQSHDQVLRFREVDILAKITEMGATVGVAGAVDLHTFLTSTLKLLNAKYQEHN